MSIILTYWKLRDSVADRGIFRGLPARLLSLLLRRAYRKAALRRPDFDRQTVACLEELHALEKDKTPSWIGQRTPLPVFWRELLRLLVRKFGTGRWARCSTM